MSHSISTRLVDFARSVSCQAAPLEEALANWRETAPRTITLQWFGLQLVQHAFALQGQSLGPIQASVIAGELRELAKMLRANNAGRRRRCGTGI